MLGPITSTETRLIISDLTPKTYDICLHEKQMAYYNFMRLHNFSQFEFEGIKLKDIWAEYNLPIIGADAFIETSIIIDYLKWNNQIISRENIVKIIDNMSRPFVKNTKRAFKEKLVKKSG